MSTNADSALAWLEQNNPGEQQIRDMIGKLQARLSSGASEEQLQGSREALQLLEDVLAQNHSPSEEQAASQPEPMPVAADDSALDSSPLGQTADITPETLSEAEKRRRFESLRQTLDTRKP